MTQGAGATLPVGSYENGRGHMVAESEGEGTRDPQKPSEVWEGADSRWGGTESTEAFALVYLRLVGGGGRATCRRHIIWGLGCGSFPGGGV